MEENMPSADTASSIELKQLDLAYFDQLKKLMIGIYAALGDNSYWEKSRLETLINLFPEGQIMVLIDGKLAGCALSIVVDDQDTDGKHTYRQITGNLTFDTHKPKGTVLYGVEVIVSPEYRGMRLGRRMYDYRKELCEKMNLEKIVFGGRMPNYHMYAEEFSPKEYIQQVKAKAIHDPVLDFQLSNDFYVKRILKGYLIGDKDSLDYAVLLQWNNVYYEPEELQTKQKKTVVRMGLVQWQMRPYKTIDDLLEQVEYFVDTVSSYRCDFVLFPEYFNAPLMAEFNHLSEPEAIRGLAKYTPILRDKLSDFAISYNINIIAGSMPELTGNKLQNVGFLCKRDGGVEKYEKIHVTPDEERVWGLTGGDSIRTFDTDCGKIGVLICYDVEFPELSRIMAQEEMQILFVPFLTDTQNGYSRVRNCAQARAIENECYVAIAGSVGNLPNVHNMDIQYAQSIVFTPCDFAFPANGIKAEATTNTEMILVVDVDINLLKELHEFGAVKNLKDRRTDLYDVIVKK
ncbi:MAG: bifunctional GNAT family N-acetyltransferase/carbon-nitrogen hydrolase family protein [Bacteroidetes bacterium]|nr:bifunctional GNAT family N-acetyltransferase/carbon-nitrogen hydrolase family protein [Bacteroidota bacterium]